jgi:ankyrin repeat protein
MFSRFSIVLIILLLWLVALPAQANNRLHFSRTVELEEQLVSYARYGPLNSVLALLTAGVDPDVAASSGTTALNSACSAGQLEVVQMLLDYDADPDLQDKWRASPLSSAARAGQTAIVNLLLERGARTDQLDQWGSTVLHDAAGYGDAEMVELLLARGMDLEALGEEGSTALHYAAIQGNLSTAAVLLDHGAEVNAGLGWRDTPLHHAAVTGKNDMIMLLLSRGAELEARNVHGLKPLHFAAWQGHKDTLSLLLAQGAQVDDIFLAAATNDVAKVIEFGTNEMLVSAEDWSGQTPYDWGKRMGADEACAALLALYAKLSDSASWLGKALYSAAVDNDLELCRQLLELGADPNWTNASGYGGLTFAAENGNLDLLNLLLQHGADPLKHGPGGSALRYAVRQGRVKAMKALLALGSPADEVDESGMTLLHEVCAASLYGSGREGQDYRACALELVGLGLDVNALDQQGWTPLDHACGAPPDKPGGGYYCGTGFDFDLQEALYLLGARHSNDPGKQ